MMINEKNIFNILSNAMKFRHFLFWYDMHIFLCIYTNVFHNNSASVFFNIIIHIDYCHITSAI